MQFLSAAMAFPVHRSADNSLHFQQRQHYSGNKLNFQAFFLTIANPRTFSTAWGESILEIPDETLCVQTF